MVYEEMAVWNLSSNSSISKRVNIYIFSFNSLSNAHIITIKHFFKIFTKSSSRHSSTLYRVILQQENLDDMFSDFKYDLNSLHFQNQQEPSSTEDLNLEDGELEDGELDDDDAVDEADQTGKVKVFIGASVW